MGTVLRGARFWDEHRFGRDTVLGGTQFWEGHGFGRAQF